MRRDEENSLSKSLEKTLRKNGVEITDTAKREIGE
jgi:outer membrane lipopolysaccharide assembly protein LptE/RlpB